MPFVTDLRKYRGRLSFLPVDKYPPPPLLERRISNQEGYSRKASGGDRHHHHNRSSRGVQFNEGDHDMHRSSSMPEGDFGSQPGYSIGDVGRASPLLACPEETTGGDGVASGAIHTPLLVPLSEPVPESWTTIDDEFILVVAMYQTHLAQDIISSPESRLDDGIIYLAFTRATTSRLRLIKLFNALEEGRAIDDPSMEIIRVRAFRLEPLTDRGKLTVDGEVVELGPIQAQVLQSMARVMTLKKDEL